EGCRMSLLCDCHDAPRNGTVISDQFNIPSGPVSGVHFRAAWQFVENVWVEHRLLVVTIVSLVAGAVISRVILPLAGRWGYEKLVIERKSKEKDRKRKSQIRTLLARFTHELRTVH